jgi:hypothetical protein
VVLTTVLEAGVDYFPTSFLSLDSLSGASGWLVDASEYSTVSATMDGIELVPLYVA